MFAKIGKYEIFGCSSKCTCSNCDRVVCVENTQNTVSKDTTFCFRGKGYLVVSKPIETGAHNRGIPQTGLGDASANDDGILVHFKKPRHPATSDGT